MGLRNWLRSWTGKTGESAASSSSASDRSGADTSPRSGVRSWFRSWLDRSRRDAEPAKRTADEDAEGTETLWDEDTDWSGIGLPDTPRSTDFTPNEQTALTGDWVHLSSTNVEQIRYLVEDSILEVIFHSGAGYQYYDVPPQTFLDFVAADSPGRFIWNRLRYWFEYTKVLDATRKSPGRHRNPFVVRRLPSESDPEPIAREHARRMGSDEAARKGTRRIRSWL